MNPRDFIEYDQLLMARFPSFVSGLVILNKIVRAEAIGPSAADLLNQDTGNAADPVSYREIAGWRSVYTKMGVNPTKVRNAAEALHRRYVKGGDLPRINTIVDICNAVSVKNHIPVAAIDLAKMALPLTVKMAAGGEGFTDISGNESLLAEGEVSYFDRHGTPHARYWNHKQSGTSAVGENSDSVLITIEAVHEDGETSVRSAIENLRNLLRGAGLVAEQEDSSIWLYRGSSLSFSELAF
jgi:DNA/RNA-binding domain of Phe-tRNA-synthetase-like protein